MPDLAEQLGTRIRAARISKGLRQEELAARSNMTRAHISHIENGQFNMRLETLEGICRGLQIQPFTLFEGINID
jgi:transcriptional regulator with XRE-family HTH domain